MGHLQGNNLFHIENNAAKPGNSNHDEAYHKFIARRDPTQKILLAFDHIIMPVRELTELPARMKQVRKVQRRP
ncbi:MAG TPA: hypothetical protein VN739_07890 [Nitrososphaerales archaeon]|nr:hypothetical protein [Nitrososphaerales archaeon]